MQYIDDKKALGEAIGGMLPAPTTDKGIAQLVKYTKYHKTEHPEFGTEIWPVKLGDGQDVVAVTRPRSHGGGTALVFRQLVDQTPVMERDDPTKQRRWPDGKPMVSNVYEIQGLRPCSSRAEAADLMQQIREAVEATAGRDIDGFGTPEADDEFLDDDITGFGAQEQD